MLDILGGGDDGLLALLLSCDICVLILCCHSQECWWIYCILLAFQLYFLDA